MLSHSIPLRLYWNNEEGFAQYDCDSNVNCINIVPTMRQTRPHPKHLRELVNL